eukprot:GHVP01069052.1.p1 GENE.GHVP01069052.1~~GHVP01069052.1.p1  ORF type:complete len:245 (-),score=67.18 GHVP01069052.1:669-1403(-)
MAWSFLSKIRRESESPNSLKASLDEIQVALDEWKQSLLGSSTEAKKKAAFGSLFTKPDESLSQESENQEEEEFDFPGVLDPTDNHLIVYASTGMGYCEERPTRENFPVSKNTRQDWTWVQSASQNELKRRLENRRTMQIEEAQVFVFGEVNVNPVELEGKEKLDLLEEVLTAEVKPLKTDEEEGQFFKGDIEGVASGSHTGVDGTLLAWKRKLAMSNSDMANLLLELKTNIPQLDKEKSDYGAI